MRYLTLGIHYPKKEHTEAFLAAVRDIATTARSQRGLIETGAWMEEAQGRAVPMSLWESEESAMAARTVLRPLLANVP